MSLPNNNGFVGISINDSSVSYPPNSKLFCNLCSCNLSLLDAEKEEWICTRCNVSYFPNRGEKVKRANRFETPGPETDKHGNITGEKMPLVSIVKDDKELSSTYGKEKLPALFKEMERRGVKITSYTTTEDRRTRRITWLVGRYTSRDCYKVLLSSESYIIGKYTI